MAKQTVREEIPLAPRPTGGSILKRILVGRSQPSWRMEHTLLRKALALPILSSDPLSSVAYATEQIMLVLLAASAGSLHLVMPIALAIAGLLAMVVISYVQVVKGYPSGGGAYVVAKDNLGTIPALIGAAALLVDYVMTVAVSVVGGVFAIVSFAPTCRSSCRSHVWRCSCWRTSAGSERRGCCSRSRRTPSSSRSWR